MPHSQEGLLDSPAESLKDEGLKDLAARTLRQCGQFYTAPIWRTVTAKFNQTIPAKVPPKSQLETLKALMHFGCPMPPQGRKRQTGRHGRDVPPVSHLFAAHFEPGREGGDGGRGLHRRPSLSPDQARALCRLRGLPSDSGLCRCGPLTQSAVRDTLMAILSPRPEEGRHMPTLTHKVQVLLSDEQHRLLLKLARAQRKSLSVLLREGVVEQVIKESRRAAKRQACDEIATWSLSPLKTALNC